MTRQSFHAVRGTDATQAAAEYWAEADRLFALIESAQRARRIGLASLDVVRGREESYRKHLISKFDSALT